MWSTVFILTAKREAKTQHAVYVGLKVVETIEALIIMSEVFFTKEVMGVGVTSNFEKDNSP